MTYNADTNIFYRDSNPVPYMALTESEKRFVENQQQQQLTKQLEESLACPF